MCHTSGTLGRQNGAMEDIYLCPDCHTEHTEPAEARLGHLVRCTSCLLLLELLADEAALLGQHLDIRIAA